MKFFITGGLLASLALLSTSAHSATVAPPTYHLSNSWKLAGDGGWDYLTLDSAAHRLYIARGTRIQVVDTESGALIGEVPGVSGAHGVALDSEKHRAYVSSGRDDRVIVFDTRTLKVVGDPIAVGQRPDAILFEPVTKRVFVFDAGSNEVSIIDTATGKVAQTVALGGNPEFGAADGVGHVWANVESTSEIVELNAADGKIMSRTSLAPGEEPTGLAADVKDGRLFSGCANKMMVVIDAKTGMQIGMASIGEGVDATAYDATRDLAFSSNGRDGTISVIGMNGANPTLLATIPTHVGARTMALDAVTGALFVVAADYEKSAPTPAGERPKRPKMIPGSAVVLKLVPGTTPTP